MLKWSNSNSRVTPARGLDTTCPPFAPISACSPNQLAQVTSTPLRSSILVKK